MRKRAFGRWYARQFWERPKRPIRKSGMSERTFNRRLSNWEARIRYRVCRISRIRKCMEDFKQYPQPHRHKIAKFDLILQALYGSTGNHGAFFLFPIILALELAQSCTMFVANRAVPYPRRDVSQKPGNTAQSGKHPVFAEYLLFLFLNRDDREQISGDLQEEFLTSVVPKFGVKRARLWYWVQTITTILRRNRIGRWLLTSGGMIGLGHWLWRKMIELS
jgi:hypothetical protein